MDKLKDIANGATGGQGGEQNLGGGQGGGLQGMEDKAVDNGMR